MERTVEAKARRPRRLIRGFLAVTLLFSAASCAAEVAEDSSLRPATTSSPRRDPSDSCGMVTAEIELQPSLHVGIDKVSVPLGEKGPAAQAEAWNNIQDAVDDWMRDDMPANASPTVSAEVAYYDDSEASAQQEAGRLAVLASEELSLPIGQPAGAYEGGDGVATLHFVPYAGGSFDSCKV